MATTIDGPRFGPEVGAKRLVVFLHGYGADGHDLIAIGRQWQDLLPDTAFVSPHAPDPCGQSPKGRQWFPLTRRDPSELWAGVTKAAPALNAFLDAELARHGLDDGALALVGFSQGTMMALHVGLRRPLAAVVGFSGVLAGSEHLPQAISRRAPPVLLVHGSEDEVVPVEALFLAANGLAEAGAPSQWHLSLGVGHGIDDLGLSHAVQFLAASFREVRARRQGDDPRSRA